MSSDDPPFILQLLYGLDTGTYVAIGVMAFFLFSTLLHHYLWSNPVIVRRGRMVREMERHAELLQKRIEREKKNRAYDDRVRGVRKSDEDGEGEEGGGGGEGRGERGKENKKRAG
uniref:Uncharacterized protein n=1 Tax=Palpitomonas bilix TaxID=652834 RepID=A0A7S3D0N2_9EUKA|mmetsp:Transcript_16769/g.42115  ORF Transcript_16769/g.42115 Transcript_16769/m.42115 type:complete len:115 (+) Transcript_16769:289-633(+)